MARLGVCIISPINQHMPYAETLALIRDAGVKVVKFHMTFSTDAIHVEQAILHGVDTIILRTGDGLDGYDYRKVQTSFEEPGGIGHFSFASLLDKYPHVQFIIEVGNEPNLSTPPINGWVARWWALALVKELRLNYLGHIDRPWKEKYPRLQWSVCLPTSMHDTTAMLTYLDNHGSDDVGDGSIIDYYDALNCHLYGDTEVISNNYDWPHILRTVQANQYVKKIHVTELGINAPNISTAAKCQKYRAWVNSNPAKVDLVTAWYLGRGQGYEHYQIDKLADLRHLTG